jgi:hypothetical protein
MFGVFSIWAFNGNECEDAVLWNVTPFSLVESSHD